MHKIMTGRKLRKDISPQIYFDENMESHKFFPGDFVFEDIIKKYKIDTRYFVHPDSLRVRGAFEDAHRLKGKFSVGVERSMNGRGDIILSSVIAKALKYKYGNDVKTWYVVKPGYEEILKHCPYVDRIFTKRKDLEDAKPDVMFNVNDLCFKIERKDFETDGKVTKNRTSIYLEGIDLWVENKTPVYIVTEKEKKWAIKELKKQKELKELGIE